MAVGSHHHPPVLIIAARIVDKERFRVMKEENPAQHILLAPVSDELRVAARIPHRDTEMVIAFADIVGDPRLCPGKHKNPRFAITTDFVLGKCRPRLWAINHYTGQNALRGAAPCHSTRGVEQIHRGILIASDIAKRDAGDATAWDLLEIEGSPTTGKYLDLISTGSYQLNRSPRDKDFVFIDPGANKYLVMLSGIEQCRTGSWVRVTVVRVDDQGLSAEWIRRRISYHF